MYFVFNLLTSGGERGGGRGNGRREACRSDVVWWWCVFALIF